MKKILIVDDQFTIRYLVEHQLKAQGYETIMAKDGPGALQAARSHQPDLIVLDVVMPEMNGFDVLEEMKADPRLANIPVIFLTSLSDKKDKLRAFEMGAEDYLTKPFQANEFIAHVTAALRSSGRITAESQTAAPEKGQVTALYSPKGGVGTTTLTIQLGEAMVLHEGQRVILIDLALPLGGLAPLLKLYTTRHVLGLLETAVEEYTLDTVLRFAQNHRANLKVIPAPSRFDVSQKLLGSYNLTPALDLLANAGYQVILDLGTVITPLTLSTLQRADKIFALTSGQPDANLHLDTFLASASQMGVDSRRILPVVNELYGESTEAKLARVPAARIPYASKSGRTRLWLTEQALRKLVMAALA